MKSKYKKSHVNRALTSAGIKTFMSLKSSSLVNEKKELTFYGGIILNSEGQYEIIENPNSQNKVAEVFYNRVIDQKGWNKLSVKTHGLANAYEQAFFAGYLEGRVSSEDIFNFFNNLTINNENQKRKRFAHLLKFFDEVAKNLNIRIINSINGFDSFTPEGKKYWSRIILGFAQLEGLMKGYEFDIERRGEKKKKEISLSDFLLIQADGEIHELMTAIKAEKLLKSNRIKIGDNNYFDVAFGIKTNDPVKFWKEMMRSSRCSAFIKILKDEENNWKDLIAGHTTWADYSELLRTYKQ